MANVAVKVLGRDRQFASGVTTVADLKQQVGVNANYTASVNGSPVENDFTLSDDVFVTLAPPVKGG